MRTPIVAALLVMALGAPAAYAHAHLDHAVPAVGSTVSTAPTEVSLFFTQNLESAFSSVTVTDANGADVGQGKAEISSNTMRVGLKPLNPGSFTVHWHAVSVDTHTTEGTFSFQIGGK
ncbi:MAG: copper resistance CopC family protein [Xanthobacteraceae bacterium]